MDNSPGNSSSRVQPNASPAKDHQSNFTIEFVSTPDIQKWMSSIQLKLNEVCSIATDGKLNSEQKLKVTNLCRKVESDTSQMAVLYQALKQKSHQALNIIDALKEKRNLTEQITELKQTIKDSGAVGTASFADMVKKRSSDFVRPNNLSSVAVYPNDKLKSSDETKNLVQNIIRPDEMKLHVRGVRKTKNGGVIISTETKQDADKLKHAVQMSTSGLTADEPIKRKPRITVVGVPTSLADADVFRFMYEQNIADTFPAMSLDTFLADVKLSHKSGKKDALTCNFVIEVPAKIRRALISQARIFINWTSCPVRDFTLVTRCYKCQQFGHAAKSCREVNSTCGHCGEAGHSMSECAKKADTPKCATCSRFKKPNSHKTGDVECPAKKLAEYRYINSIDYEGA